MIRYLRSLLAAALVGLSAAAASAAELIMVEEAGCIWCGRWNAEIAEIYPKTPEGTYAPLRRIDLRQPLPPDLTLTSRPRLTPTFILVEEGVELARLEGYPGEDFFWAILDQMLTENTDFAGGT